MCDNLPWAPVELVYEKAYTNVSIVPFLRKRVEILTLNYQTDFEKHDVKRIYDAANSKDPLDKHFVWICRKFGTNYCKERDVFVSGTLANQALLHIASGNQYALGFFVEVLGQENGKILGNVFMLNLQEYRNEVIQKAQLPKARQVSYQDGFEEIMVPETSVQRFGHGDIVNVSFLPESEAELAKILASHKNRRDIFRLAEESNT